jgi:hypothetical protein
MFERPAISPDKDELMNIYIRYDSWADIDERENAAGRKDNNAKLANQPKKDIPKKKVVISWADIDESERELEIKPIAPTKTWTQVKSVPVPNVPVPNVTNIPKIDPNTTLSKLDLNSWPKLDEAPKEQIKEQPTESNSSPGISIAKKFGYKITQYVPIEPNLVDQDKKLRSELFKGCSFATIVKLADVPTADLAIAIENENRLIAEQIAEQKNAEIAEQKIAEQKIAEQKIAVRSTVRSMAKRLTPAYYAKYRSRFPNMRPTPVVHQADEGFTAVQPKVSKIKPNSIAPTITSVVWAFVSPSPFSAKYDTFLQAYEIYKDLHYPIGWISMSTDGTRWKYHHKSPIVHVRYPDNTWEHFIGDRLITVAELHWHILPESYRKTKNPPRD